MIEDSKLKDNIQTSKFIFVKEKNIFIFVIMKSKQEKKLAERFAQEIEKQGRKRSWVANHMMLANSHITNILNPEHPSSLLEKHREKLNEILGTKF